jgi:hypothetical protein
MTAQRDGLLNKIRALLTKTIERGCSEAEALAALDKAHAMMDVYVVTEAELKLTREEKAILRREPPGTKDPHRIKRLLANSVARFCGCQSWSDGWRKDRILVFCGLPSDAQFATWLLDALTTFVQSELVKHLMTPEAASGERREVIGGFVAGATERTCQRLNELCEQSAKALVVVKDTAI